MDWAAPNLPIPAPNKGDTAAATFDAKLQKELSRLDSSVPFNPRTAYLHHTWAQTFFSRPEFYFQPASVPELQKIVTLARRLRKRLCVTGFGHSPSDITCTSSWLINLDNLNRVLDLQSSGVVRFEGGISLHDLNAELAGHGLTLPNLGSIDVQSVAGSIATGTHGSSLRHGLISSSILSLTLLLSNSQLITCSPDKNPELFRAALVSLGSLGIIVEITMQVVPDFNISWTQSLHSLSSVLARWSTNLWTQQEYTRVWWMPYSQRAVIWSATKTTEPLRSPETTFYGGAFGYYLYHNLLYLAHYIPRILPTVEWLIFGMQYGFRPGDYTMSAVQPAREGLLMDCLYSQFVNEWALPLSRGPEAITRLDAWIHNKPQSQHGIPFSPGGVWVHCPIEVRVSTTETENNRTGVRAYLDPLHEHEPTLYLNATLYRPYGKDPPCWKRYYQAFEWLMRDLGGRPHWAKNFEWTSKQEIADMYGDDMQAWLKVRADVDPDGLFVGEWQRRTLMIGPDDDESNATIIGGEWKRHVGKMGRKWGDGLFWEGELNNVSQRIGEEAEGASVKADAQGALRGGKKEGEQGDDTPSPPSPATATSEESFDYMAKGEASVYAVRE
ncbi:uncharacterized protein HMPREF1541_03799 [Cyphellophora europaea CBS 101466]|uniref:D-arabinono-1,4-lactone oxidase n=1 Tax=Cyphellophora europaea (strain CBS 101466) TaxID=1220924 RepID=W2RZU5_CYPE1|nr:uncharacterized protein HMPREF1541_03799 [Cyphellophora europaea CBS 101466]ETN41860.1 hypothetical protein HMPREF1541_03799 [Cyphellophora europaea CBS 101466]